MNNINIHNPIIDDIRKQHRMVQKLHHALYVSLSILYALENSLKDEAEKHS